MKSEKKLIDRGILQVCVGADGPIKKHLEARASRWTGESPHIAARRDLERYYDLLGRSLARVVLSEGEASLIVDVLNGTASDVRSAGTLWLEIEDGIKIDDLDKKWKIDGPALVAKAREWNLAECLAIVDAAERFWIGVGRSDNMETRDRLIAVGLIRG